MAAEVVDDELKLDLYRVDLAAVVSKWIGETERNLERLFQLSETANAQDPDSASWPSAVACGLGGVLNGGAFGEATGSKGTTI